MAKLRIRRLAKKTSSRIRKSESMEASPSRTDYGLELFQPSPAPIRVLHTMAVEISETTSVAKYRQYIKILLMERAQRSNLGKDAEEYEIEILFDTDRDHYHLLHVGWSSNHRSLVVP